MTRAYMSFGGGVQSTAIAMLALNKDRRLLEVTGGRVPELYLWADTGDESLSTYRHVWDMAEKFALHNVNFVATYRGSLLEHMIQGYMSGSTSVYNAPFWTVSRSGKFAPIRRECTAHYKVAELEKAAKRYFKVQRSKPNTVKGGFLEKPVECWLGISIDEIQRMKSSVVQWQEFFHPLIEMRWTRGHCLEYLESINVFAGKSACVYCPFHGSKEWREVKDCAQDWFRVLELDQALEAAYNKHGRVGCLKERPFLTQHGKPIEDIDFSKKQLSFFDMECAGVCGV